ncbi:MAG: amidoligase family protein [Gammaproteobacteria bacterium]
MTDSIGLPPRRMNHAGEERHVGVELEMAGLEPLQIVACIQSVFGGQLERISRFEYRVVNTSLGKFAVELDASYLKSIGYKLEKKQRAENEAEPFIESLATDIITAAAEQIVPWELASPPVPLSRLHEISKLFNALRQAGALGTRSSLVYAFGLHLNPELPALDVNTILTYLRAFLCLFEWIAADDDTDLTRRLTSYINHFNKPYIQKVLDPHYRPDLYQFMADYMEANPTRNRTLDLLPLFAWLDEPFLRANIEDPRVKGRPTLHYRLPNSDIDNPQWNLRQPWQEWLEVEKLANSPLVLRDMCAAYAEHLDKLLPDFDGSWLRAIDHWRRKL